MKQLPIIFTAIFLLATAVNGFSQQDKRVKQFNLNKTALAIDGYDPVSYFTTNKAVKGEKNISYAYQGINYRFSTEANKKLFAADPSKGNISLVRWGAGPGYSTRR